MSGLSDAQTAKTASDRPIYLDNHATTPVDPRVVEAMLPYFSEMFGNPASRTHAFGWEAEAAVEAARGQTAEIIGARTKEIVFTSGATEADNLAIKGALAFYADKGRHVVTVASEHKAVLDCCRRLERDGLAEVTYVKPRRDGLVDVDELAAAVTESTVLISVMHANSEIGVIQPLRDIGVVARDKHVLFHCDAAQSVGKIDVDVDEMNIDMLSLSAHKLYGPKGVGALFVRTRGRRVRLKPLLDGGGQERGMRSGTLNVASIVGLGRACEIARHEMGRESERLRVMRDRLYQRLIDALDGVYLNGALEPRLAGNLNLSFAGIEAEALLMALRDVALSSGSACTSSSLEPSHVLRAIGVNDRLARGSVRFGLGRFNDQAQIDTVASRVIEEVERLRGLVSSAPKRSAGADGGAGQRAGESIR